MEAAKKTGRKNSYYGVKNGFNTFPGNKSNFSIRETTNEKQEKGRRMDVWMREREREREWLLNIEANRSSYISFVIHTHTINS